VEIANLCRVNERKVRDSMSLELGVLPSFQTKTSQARQETDASQSSPHRMLSRGRNECQGKGRMLSRLSLSPCYITLLPLFSFRTGTPRRRHRSSAAVINKNV